MEDCFDDQPLCLKFPCLYTYAKKRTSLFRKPFPKLICLRFSDCPCHGKLSMNFRYFSLQSTIDFETGTMMTSGHAFGVRLVLQASTAITHSAQLPCQLLLFGYGNNFLVGCYSVIAWTQETSWEGKNKNFREITTIVSSATATLRNLHSICSSASRLAKLVGNISE